MPTMTQQEQQRGKDASLAARIRYVGYSSEKQLGAIMALVDRDLSEPYSIFTYRYFLRGWPDLCILAYIDDNDDSIGAAENQFDSNKIKSGGKDDWHGTLVGVIVGKADDEGSTDPKNLCGYIAMLAVETSYRRAGIGQKLVGRAVDRMVEIGCKEVALEAEVTNTGALHLYERQGFVREERLFRYYLNGVDAFRLKLWLAGGVEDGGGGEGDGRHHRIHQHSPGEEEGGGCCGGVDHHHHQHDEEEEAEEEEEKEEAEEEEEAHGHPRGGHGHSHDEGGSCCCGHLHGEEDESDNIAAHQSLALLSLESRMVGAARETKPAANGDAVMVRGGEEGQMK